MKRILTISLILLCFGCSKEKEKANIEISCDNTISSVEISEGNTISCKLLGETYELEVKKITKDEIKFESNKYGLTSNYNIIEKNKDFNLNNELKLKTQTTDVSEYLIIKRK